MSAKRIIIIVVIILTVFGGSGYWIGYSAGYANGNAVGWGKGYEQGKYDSYEKGYSLGYDNGKEYVVAHLDQYIKVPKAVSYEEVLEFLRSDQTDKIEYSDDFDCASFSNVVRNNAISKGIKCGIASFNAENMEEHIGHAINCFETTDRGIVYFDPQTDGERYDIRVGGYYTLSERYRITKVDIIW